MEELKMLTSQAVNYPDLEAHTNIGPTVGRRQHNFPSLIRFHLQPC